ncbi:MAG: DUF898 family protein [Caulobacterales bacterium]
MSGDQGGPAGFGGSADLVFSEDIKLRRFIGLSFKNLLLTILTLTLYNFWARTEVRKRVWAGTIINDEPLEYRGKGKELFIGFLLVTFCVLLPASLILGLAHLFLGQEITIFIGTLFYLTAGYLSFVAIYRARAYLLSRTSWRGVRLIQGPDWGWGFGWSMVGHVVMTMITLGWWTPRMRMRIAHDLWSRTSWGDEKFIFNEGETKNLAGGLYASYAVAWFGGWVVMIAAFGAAFAAMMALSAGNPAVMMADPQYAMTAMLTLYALVIPAAVLAAFISLPYQAAVYRRIADKLRIDNLRFKLGVGSLALFWLSLGNLLIIVFSLGILSPLAQARSWRFLVRRLSTEGSIDLAAIHQAASRGPGAGEGLADAMHVSVLDGGL